MPDEVRKQEIIRKKGIDMLVQDPGGLRWAEWVRRVQAALPESRGIPAALFDLDRRRPGEVYKPEPGLWKLVRFRDTNEENHGVDHQPAPAPIVARREREKPFYKPFAEYLRDELNECTKVLPLGLNKFGGKFGTPDVIGIREIPRGEMITFQAEIVAAEIKAITGGDVLITAFGQVCSYKLFAHKSYLAIPTSTDKEDVERLDALCRIVGVGLVLFDSSKPDNPDWQIRTRAVRYDPDMFYVNRNMKLIPELFK